MAAAVHEEACLARRNHGRSERQSGYRPARALADAVGDRDDASGPVVALLETAGDDANDAGMPPLARREHQRRVAVAAFDLIDRLRQDARLELAAFGIEYVKLACDRQDRGRIVARQQLGAEIGLADAAAGIDARPQDEAGVVGVEPL